MFVLKKVANKQILTIIRQGDNKEKREEGRSKDKGDRRMFELLLPSCELLGGNWNVHVHKQFHSWGADPPIHRQNVPLPHARAHWTW